MVLKQMDYDAVTLSRESIALYMELILRIVVIYPSINPVSSSDPRSMRVSGTHLSTESYYINAPTAPTTAPAPAA